MKIITVICNTDNIENAELISSTLIEKELAACVNIVPGIKSCYKWKGKTVKDSEFMLLIKTRKSLFKKVQDEIIKLHNYELPEVIEIDINTGYDKYIKWIYENTKE